MHYTACVNVNLPLLSLLSRRGGTPRASLRLGRRWLCTCVRSVWAHPPTPGVRCEHMVACSNRRLGQAPQSLVPASLWGFIRAGPLSCDDGTYSWCLWGVSADPRAGVLGVSARTRVWCACSHDMVSVACTYMHISSTQAYIYTLHPHIHLPLEGPRPRCSPLAQL